VLPGVTYVESSSSRSAYEKTSVAAHVHAFAGGISRDAVIDGATIGSVQSYRFNEDVAASERAWFVPMLVFSAGGSTPTPSKVGGMTVHVAAPRSGEGPVVVGWQQLDVVVLVSAPTRARADQLVARYILGGS
jgi:hypothetical protein